MSEQMDDPWEWRTIELREGWHWPVNDEGCWQWVNREADLPQQIMKYVSNFTAVAHAGANTGFYVRQYAKRFQTVLAFEPHPVNFACLALNCPEHHVIKIQAALGKIEGRCSLWNEWDDPAGTRNAGGWQVKPGANYPILALDRFILWPVGLIHLDVEGYEHQVLSGAIEMLTEHRPIVCLETIRPRDDQLAYELLASLGYEVLEILPHDTIFGPSRRNGHT